MQRNPLIPFTYKYSQPVDYHFSIDSIEMAWEVANDLADTEVEIRSDWKILDLCAGCGVIGFDLNFHLPQLRQIDFVEVQSCYQAHFEANRKMVLNAGTFRFSKMNYDELKQPQFKRQYDVIVCNPPYFQLQQGKLSPSQFKNRCRFFIDSTFENLIQALLNCLAEQGRAYLLLRTLEDHGLDVLRELKTLIRGQLKCENLTMIRGTFLLKLYR